MQDSSGNFSEEACLPKGFRTMLTFLHFVSARFYFRAVRVVTLGSSQSEFSVNFFARVSFRAVASHM